MPDTTLFPDNHFAALEQLATAGLDVDIKVLRLDSYCAHMSGNKFFKLKNNILHALEHSYTQLLSFGGAWSNHIHALALAGQKYGIDTVGVIRGERLEPLNPTLEDAERAGMKLHFVSREEYRRRDEKKYLQELQQLFPTAMLIPEGGSNLRGVIACGEIIEHIHHHIGTDYDCLALACGTGATLAGLLSAVPEDKSVLGFSVLKAENYIQRQVNGFLEELAISPACDWHVEESYHCGGYAKVNAQLANFVKDFQRKHNIALDHIYTGKCFYGLFDLINKGEIPRGSRLVVIHSGGLQGERGLQQQLTKLSARRDSSQAGLHQVTV